MTPVEEKSILLRLPYPAGGKTLSGSGRPLPRRWAAGPPVKSYACQPGFPLGNGQRERMSASGCLAQAERSPKVGHPSRTRQDRAWLSGNIRGGRGRARRLRNNLFPQIGRREDYAVIHSWPGQRCIFRQTAESTVWNRCRTPSEVWAFFNRSLPSVVAGDLSKPWQSPA